MPRRSKQLRRFGAALLGLALVASACGGASEDASSAGDTGGSGLPALTGATVSGGQIDTNDLAGQDVVVWFWAPW